MDQTGPRRRPAHGGYTRGDEKRLRIVEVALRVFGEHGYEKTSTRQIAKEAGVNPPALQYYFDGKEGLHLACAEHIVERITQALRPAFDAADQIAAADVAGATDCLCAVLDALAHFLFEALPVEGWSRFLARGQGEGVSPAYVYLKQEVSGRLHSTCARLVGIAIGRPGTESFTKLCAISILGQLTGFHAGREKALTTLCWQDFSGERLDQLSRIVSVQTRAILAAHRGVAETR